ncbi:O-acetyl transferase [Listeria weihenstephanensis FSL R9-0317]|uniref:acyltransferase family protein n=1 Tax=Listeria weihenstephanensis TaxID=1006155 RepID=UPI0003E8C0FC|nr:acyltransferase family protein [Listeria weihenstephanensis]EUJ40102.1 O-acetyl transferase [Listeria weihenstephanensis FSL R9-0317]
MTKTNRIDWMDTAKGIGIFLVVWGHFYASDTLKIVIYGFHMPLFFFLSGYLYKERAMSFLAFVKKKSKQLLLPFLMFQAVTFLIVNGLTFVASKQLDASPIKLVSEFFFLNGDLGFNSPLWFLVVLFSVEILFFLFMRYIPKGQGLVVLAFLLLAVLLSTQSGDRFTFGLHIVPLSWLFYYAGFQCHAWYFLTWHLLNKWYNILLMGFSYLWTLFYLNQGQVVGFRSNNLGNFLIFAVASILGILVFCLICKKIGKSKLWGQFGRQSLFIMGTHYFFLIFFSNIWKIITDNPLNAAYPTWTTFLMTCFAFTIYYLFFRIQAFMYKSK